MTGAFRGTIVAGIGFRHAAACEEIVALVRRALVEGGAAPADLAAIATARDRAAESAIREAAETLGIALVSVEADALITVDADVPTRSARIEASRGVGSLAEAAALAGAGAGARLILARIASPSATCALALRAQSATQGG